MILLVVRPPSIPYSSSIFVLKNLPIEDGPNEGINENLYILVCVVLS